ncbi:MAG: PHP domain-containing protein [Phycisphaerae bacterium]|nr:PHP domain-containing protein [Phycisphaerae bacterium]
MANNISALIHIHTDYSFDSNISLEILARFVAEHDFGCVAVTDHDTIEGAWRLRSMTDAKVIIGEEITTSQGHLIGLFLSEHVPAGMSAMETARAIRAQGGLVLLPHPFARVLGCGLNEVAWEIADLIDAVEVNNAQSFWPTWDRQADDFADRLGLPKYAGADSHMASSIAPCYQTMPEFTSPSDFTEALRAAKLKVGYHSPAYFAATGFRDARYLLGLGLPAPFGANATAGVNGMPQTPAARVA